MLVSEFPPPPFYYRAAAAAALAASSAASAVDTPGGGGGVAEGFVLQPPEIPVEALQRGTRRAAVAAAKARAESERLRLGDDDNSKTTDAILGGTVHMSITEQPEEEGHVVAVFGEIVEDALLVEPLDRCEDPRVVRDAVKRLNQQVVHGFVKLVQDLVHQPLENKYVCFIHLENLDCFDVRTQQVCQPMLQIGALVALVFSSHLHSILFFFGTGYAAHLLRKTRDELSHNVFLMLQECNKFREHQARELLIELLEKQLEERKVLLKELQGNIAEADELLHLAG